MSTTLEPRPGPRDAWLWWEGRRLRYNIAMALAGALAWGLTTLEILIITPGFESGQWPITLSNTLWQGLAWLLVMAAANLCFLLGPVSERILRPDDPDAYRRRAFSLGFWFSVALPFLFPAVMLAALLAEAGF